MMIALIDDRNANRRAGQTMCDLKTTEAGAHDNDVMGVRRIAQCLVASDLNRGINAKQPMLIEPLID
jgi:hypothetical protein